MLLWLANMGLAGGTSDIYNKNESLYFAFDKDFSIRLEPMRMPNWNTNGRPSSPKDFECGFNSETGELEVYNGSAWVTVAMT